MTQNIEACLSALDETGDLDAQGLRALLEDGSGDEALLALAQAKREAHFGRRVFLRGLIEVSSYCRNDCLYCGLRRSNRQCERYRLSPQEIMDCCGTGYALGFRTFVLQGGEDPGMPDAQVAELIRRIRSRYPDCAITLSVGERSEAVYRQWKAAGADRYLLRHETADPIHYGQLHPREQTLDTRVACLRTLKRLGYQTGAGMMVGSPYQGTEQLVRDLQFLKRLEPEMIGIGPFIPNSQTPFAGKQPGSVALTLRLVAILRLMHPMALIPATTALGTLEKDGRIRGFRAGANVIMPNLTPSLVRRKYRLYDGKNEAGDEAEGQLKKLLQEIQRAGCVPDWGRGDAPKKEGKGLQSCD